MAKTLQFRRGTTGELSAETGAVGELFVDTTKDTVVVMDGSTGGGFPLQKELVSGTNIKTVNGTSLLGSGDVVIADGADGVGVPAGGTTGQVLAKIDGTDYNTQWVDQTGGGGGTAYDQDLNTTDDVVFNSALIGDVYYENNIVSPVPVISTTSYGTVTTVPPLVVNGPLNVLSADTSDTAILTYTDTFGFFSGGTNNRGDVEIDNSAPENDNISFFLNFQGGSQDEALFRNLRVGDIVTCIGTNGFFTGSVSFTLSDLWTDGPGDLTGNRIPSNVYMRGKLLEDGTFVGQFNANIIQVFRPYAATTITGTLQADVIDSTQIVTDQLVVNESLYITGNLVLGAARSENKIASQDMDASADYNVPSLDVSKTNLQTISFSSTTSFSWTGFGSIFMGLPEKTRDGLREIDILVKWSIRSAQPIAFTSTQAVTYVNLAGAAVTYTVPILWKDGPPTASPTHTGIGYQLFKFKIAITTSEPEAIFASYENYSRNF